MKIGIFPGKFCPLHRGHIHSIIQAATQVDMLYVVISYRDDPKVTAINGIHITRNDITIWLKEQFKNLSHIKVISIDETALPLYPYGWKEWTELVKSNLPFFKDNQLTEDIELTIFGGEEEYRDEYLTRFSPCTYAVYDPTRNRFNISATEIRQNIYENWKYLPSIVRKTFVKRILITGTESCGKTTLVRYLAKIYNTSWSEEVGREYANNYLGGDETLFTEHDFHRIINLQKEQDRQAIIEANQIVFIDTDPVVTFYYASLYLNDPPWMIEDLLKHYTSDYDLIMILTPDVKWVADGQRYNDYRREDLHNYLKRIYDNLNMPYIEISGNYQQRLETTIKLLQEKYPEIQW